MIDTGEITLGAEPVGGYTIERDASGRVLRAAFWGLCALLAAEAEATAARAVAEQTIAVVDTHGVGP